MTPPSVLIVGAGNAYRRDDGAGIAAVNRLGKLPADVRVLVAQGDAPSLLDEWPGADLVILIDATMSGAAPGTIRRYDANAGSLPAVFSHSSTHALGPGDVIELARQLRLLPARLVVFGIEGDDFRTGEGLSPAVDVAVNEVVATVSAMASGVDPAG